MGDGLSTSDARDARLGRIIEDAIAEAEAGRPLAIEELVQRHPELAEELRDLLPAAEMLLRLGRSSTDSPTSGGLSAGQPLGDFRIIREIGKGGMGVVYEAEQLSLGRRVALKVLPLASMLDKQHLARFQIEARAVATLTHPHIIPVYAVGSDRGVHYYAMQLIEGRSLAQVIDELRGREPGPTPRSTVAVRKGEGETTREATSTVPGRDTRAYFRTVARLMADAADAIEHAHQRGILHRDVKPANLLLDERGKLWVADFGLAQLGGQSQLTLTGDLVGTLRYMSPEQALGKRAAVDARADVYALGATLFELLTLQPVYGDADREELLAKLALAEPPAARQVNPHVPIDLETIVGKALEREPAERYLTAGELADDLRRYLAEQPILARPATGIERAVKYFRRRPAVAASLAAALVVMSVTMFVAALLINRSRQGALSALERTSELLYAADMTAAFQAWEKNWADEVRTVLDKHRPQSGERDRRGFEWHLLDCQTRPPESYALRGHQGPVHELAPLPDGNTLASVGEDGALRIWDLQTRRCRHAIALSAKPLYAVANSPDGRYLAVGGLDSSVYLCDRQNANRVRRLYTGEYSIQSLAFAADGKRLAAGYRYEEVCLLDLDGRLIARRRSGARLRSLRYVAATNSWRFPQKVDHPDGTSQQVIQQWSGDLAKLEKEFRSIGDSENDVHFGVGSSVGNFLVGGDEYSGLAVIFDVNAEREIDRTPRSRDQLHCLDVSPKGERVALGFRNGLVECFTIDRDLQGSPRWSPRPHVFRACEGNLFDVKFLDADTLATAGPDGLVRVWDVDVDRSLIERLPQGKLLEMAVSPTGQAIVCCQHEAVFIIDAATGHAIRRLPLAKGSAPRAVWSPSGRRIAVWANGASVPVQVYDQNGRLACEGPPPSTESRVAISPDDKILAVFQSQLRLVDLQTGEQLWETPLPQEGPPGWQALFSHDGRRLAYSGRESAFGGHKPKLVLLDVQQRRKLFELPVEEDVACMAFSPDDSTLATGHGDSLLRIWDLRHGRLLKILAGHAGVVRHIAFAPGGDRLITDSDDGTARVWSIRHERSFGVLPHPHHAFGTNKRAPSSVAVSLSSDGSRVALSTMGEDRRPVLAILDVQVHSAP